MYMLFSKNSTAATPSSGLMFILLFSMVLLKNCNLKQLTVKNKVDIMNSTASCYSETELGMILALVSGV